MAGKIINVIKCSARDQEKTLLGSKSKTKIGGNSWGKDTLLHRLYVYLYLKKYTCVYHFQTVSLQRFG